jgi:hypothetical protein
VGVLLLTSLVEEFELALLLESRDERNDAMLRRVLRFVRLPLVMLVLFAIGRFSLGLAKVPYAPRGNAIFSIVVLAIVSSIYFGALSGKVGGFSWSGAILTGVVIGFFAQLLIFSATLATYLGGLDTYYSLGRSEYSRGHNYHHESGPRQEGWRPYRGTNNNHGGRPHRAVSGGTGT